MNPELVTAATLLNVLLTGLLIILIDISLLESTRAFLRIPAKRGLYMLDRPRDSPMTTHLGIVIAVILCLWLDVDLLARAFSLDTSFIGKVVSGIILGGSAVMIYKMLPPCLPRSVSATTEPPQEQE